MTTREYLDKMSDIDERICALNQERSAVMKEYVNSLPFKVDDYVRIVDNNYSTEEVWIAGIKVWEFGPGQVTLYVNRHRKDGSRSKTEMAYYGIKIKDVKILRHG